MIDKFLYALFYYFISVFVVTSTLNEIKPVTTSNSTMSQEPVKISDLRIAQADNYYVLFRLLDEDGNVVGDCNGAAEVKIYDKAGVLHVEEFDVSSKDFYDMHYLGTYHYTDVYILQISEGEIAEIGDIMKIELVFITESGKKVSAERHF